MEDLLLKIAQQVVAEGVGTILAAGGVGTILAAGGLFVLYKLGNKYLDKRRSRETSTPETSAKPGNNGKGDEHARLLILQELNSCNARHNSKWEEVKSGIIGAVREEIRQEVRELHGRIDKVFEVIAHSNN